MTKNAHGIYVTTKSLLSDKYIFGYSTVANGDMRLKASQEKLCKILKIPQRNAVFMTQNHSNTIDWVDPKDISIPHEQVDGLLTDERNIYLFVKVADCLPITLIDPYTRVISVVHAGWRGLYNNIIQNAVSKFKSHGSEPINLFALLGPCIRVECYEVGDEIYKLFNDKFGTHLSTINYFTHANEKYHLNLPEFAKMQLLFLGLKSNNIYDQEICTKDSVDLYSYRKDKTRSGLFVSFVARL